MESSKDIFKIVKMRVADSKSTCFYSIYYGTGEIPICRTYGTSNIMSIVPIIQYDIKYDKI